MSQNRSTAVMQRRRIAPDSLDYFPTPPFATRALCEFLDKALGGGLSAMSCWEPACGEMHMARPLCEYFAAVRASDVHRYSPDHELIDFALTGRTEPPVDVVVSNPPFKLAQAFIETALAVARVGVAMLVRSAFLEGQTRFTELFKDRAPQHVLQFTERVAMLEGRLVRVGEIDPFAVEPGTKVGSATAYAWLVWLHGEQTDTRLHWIPPCRLRLERAGDYPDYRAVAPTLAAEEGGLLSAMEAPPCPA